MEKSQYDKIIGLYEARDYFDCFELLYKHTVTAKLYFWFLILLSFFISFVSIYYSSSLKNNDFTAIGASLGIVVAAVSFSIGVAIGIIVGTITSAIIGFATIGVAFGCIVSTIISVAGADFTTFIGVAIGAWVATIIAVSVAVDAINLFTMIGCKISMKEITKMGVVC
jgi:hypothetical protein